MSARAIGFGLLGTGAVVAAAGGIMAFTTKKPGAKKPAAVKTDQEQPVVAADNPVPPSPAPETTQQTIETKGYPLKYTVFDTKTRYLSEKTTIYIPLHRLYMFLQFDDERLMFREAISHMDNLMGLEALFRNNHAEKVTLIPVAAHSAKGKVSKLLRAIVAYSEASRPSSLKLADMTAIADELIDAMNNIVYNLDMTLSSMDMSAITGNKS